MARRSFWMRFLLVATVCCGVWTTAAAQEADTLRAYELDPVVVTGTRIPKQKSQLPASLTVVTRAEIEASGAFNALPIAARRVPGLFLQARATTGFGVAPGSGGAVSIRGVSGAPNTRVLMLIDGQPQFMGIFGHPISDAYAASDVERIEVIRGPASVLYGSNAMAGAVNLITRRVREEGLHATLTSSYGSFDTHRHSAAAGYRTGPFSAFASVNHNRTGGIREDRDDSFRMLGGYLKATYQPGAHFRFSADGTLIDARFHDPGPTTAATAPVDARRDYLRGRTALSVENTFSRVEGALMFFYSFGEHDFSGGFASEDVDAGVTFYQNLKLRPSSVLTLGTDYKVFGGHAATATPGGPLTLVDDEHVGELDLYALFQQGISDALSLNAGARLVNNTRYGAEWVPAFGAAYALTPSTTLRASVAKGFRSPALVDLFIGPVANTELEPERLWNYEVGASHAFVPQRLRLEATVFRSRARDLIQVVGGPGVAPRRMNAADFTTTGLELQADYAPLRYLHLSARYAYLHLDTPTLLAPEHDLHLDATLRFERVEARLGAHRVDGLYTDVDDGLQQHYLLVDAHLTIRLHATTSVFLQGENLLDETYQIDFGYPMPGVTLFGGVRVQL